MRTAFSISGCILLVLAGFCGYPLFQISVKHRAAMQERQRIFERYYPKFMHDQQSIAQHDFFQVIGKKNDAGPVLNAHVPWHKVPERKQKNARLTLPADWLEANQKWLKARQWFSFANSIDLSELEFGWMKNLMQYDHWNIENTGARENHFSNHINVTLDSLPVPEYMHFIYWAKLRLLKGIKDKRMLDALTEVRHLARLVHSSDVVEGYTAAIIILKAEAEANRHAVAKNLLPEGAFASFDRATLTSAMLAHRQMNLMLTPDKPLSVYEDILTGKIASTGICGSIFTGISTHMKLKKFWPGIDDRAYLQKRELLQKIANRFRSSCNVRYPFAVLEDPSRFSDHIEELERDLSDSLISRSVRVVYQPFMRTLLENEYVRRHYATALFVDRLSQNDFVLYENRRPAGKKDSDH